MNDSHRSDDELLDALDDALDVPVPPAPADRVAALRAAVEQRRADVAVAGTTPGTVTSIGGPSRRTWLLGGAAAAVGMAGGVAGVVIGRATSDDEAADPGPPTEPMSWSYADTSTAAAIVGRTINHTWGVELLLDATGFAVGEHYGVVFVSAEGTRTDAGGFIGAELPMKCRCNAPVLRADVASMEVIGRDGAVVATGSFA